MISHLLAQGPAIPVEAPLLPPLLTLLGLAVAFGLVYVAHQLCSGLFGVARGIVNQTIGRIPWIGGKVSGGLHSIEQRVNNYLVKVIEGLQDDIASAWHRLAAATAHLGYTIAHLARAVARVAWYVESRYSLEALFAKAGKALWNTHLLQRLVHKIEAITHTTTRVIYRPLSHPLRSAVHAGTVGLEGDFERFRDWTIPRLKYLVPEVALIGLTIRNLRRWLRRHLVEAGTLAFAAAVAIAFKTLGVNWTRCTNWRRLGRAGCNLPLHLLEDFLALATDFLILANICQVIPWLESAFEEVGAPLVSHLAKAGAGICGKGYGHPAKLGVPLLHTPTVIDGHPHLA